LKVLLALMMVLTFQSCLSEDAELDIELLHLDFENDSYYPWEGQFNEKNFKIVTDKTDRINKCATFTIFENGDLWLSPNNGTYTARSELQKFNCAKINTTMYYSWDFMIPNDYEENNDWQIIGQFHDQPDASAGATWATYPAHSPPISIKYRNGMLIVSVYSWDSFSIMDIAAQKITKGEWHNLRLKITWSENSNGSLQAWLNDTSIASPSGLTEYKGRNCFNKACNYLKIGLYRSNTITTRGTVYFDNITSYY
jgi:Polysaccharide lyase